MKTFTLVYIYPALSGDHDLYAARFVGSYMDFPPDYPHRTLVVSNGGIPTTTMKFTFAPIDCQWAVGDNAGMDIGAYVSFAPLIETDVMLCMGQSVHFHRRGWMQRMAEAWDLMGPGMHANSGSHASCPHLQTTCFWCPPKLVADHPVKVVDRSQRYDFEHGPNALWKRAIAAGMGAWQVNWDAVRGPGEWRMGMNIFWRGNQTNMLCWNNHTDVYQNYPARRAELEGYANYG